MEIKIVLTEEEIKAIWQVAKLTESKQPAFTIYLDAIRDSSLADRIGSIFNKLKNETL